MAYLSAKLEQKQVELYAMDLLWLDVKRHYDKLRQPSDVYFNRNKKDERNSKQIIEDTLKGLGGE